MDMICHFICLKKLCSSKMFVFFFHIGLKYSVVLVERERTRWIWEIDKIHRLCWQISHGRLGRRFLACITGEQMVPFTKTRNIRGKPALGEERSILWFWTCEFWDDFVTSKQTHAGQQMCRFEARRKGLSKKIHIYESPANGW